MKSANLRKILGNSYEKVMKKSSKLTNSKIGVVTRCANKNNDVSLCNFRLKR